MKASDFEGCVRCYHTSTPRDVPTNKVPVQLLNHEGAPYREIDVDERLVASARRVARREHYTLNQMLARMFFEGVFKEGGAS